MLISESDLDRVVSILSSTHHVAFDTETTGLNVWHQDRLFAVVFSDGKEEFYFNFNPRVPGFLDRNFVKRLQPIFNHGLRFAHNAKFDMHFLAKEGIEFNCEIHDTEVVARILRNDQLSYSLDNCVKRELGEAKDDGVIKWMEENEAYSWFSNTAGEQKKKNFHFDWVPMDIIRPYAEKDARLTFALATKQLLDLTATPTLLPVYEMEKRLTPVCYRMEKRGIKIDIDYCKRAVEHETKRFKECEKKFVEQTGLELINSGKHLAPIFVGLGFTVGKTKNGNPEVTDGFLATIDHPVARIVRDWRDAQKRCFTYFQGFLDHADEYGIIHPNMRQGGTRTGRFSYQEPNLQNVTKEDDEDSIFPIRRAFVPREGHAFFMIDYQAMEFRMMLDYAGQMDLIKKVKAGHDPHQATADLTGLSRKAAKTLNFGLLYGMGIAKLGNAIDVGYDEAKKFKAKYFDALPEVENLIGVCTRTARDRGFVFDWLGRRFYFDDPDFAYKAINAVIQGGCADVVKTAMVGIDFKLIETATHMLLQIHDELVLEAPLEIDEINSIYLVKKLMEESYKSKHLPLTCSVSHSVKSWGEVVEGMLEETRDEVQGKGLRGVGEATQSLVREDTAANH